MRWWCHTHNGFFRDRFENQVSKSLYFRKSGAYRYANWCFKELDYNTQIHRLQGKLSKKWLDYTAKQDSKIEKYSVWAAKLYRIVVLAHLASHFTTANNLLDQYEKTGWKKSHLPTCLRWEWLLQNGNRNCPQGPKSIARKDWAGEKQGRERAHSAQLVRGRVILLMEMQVFSRKIKPIKPRN